MEGKLLIADDEPGVLRVLESRLGLKGFEVVTASDGSAALSLFKRERPDLVLLGLHLPRLDSMSVLKKVRKFDPKAGVIVMAAQKGARRSVMLEGAWDLITKPLDLAYVELLLLASMVLRKANGRAR